jgi:hypothetical protein
MPHVFLICKVRKCSSYVKVYFHMMLVCIKYIQGISRVKMSLEELKMQPTIHFQSERGYFKYCIVLK